MESIISTQWIFIIVAIFILVGVIWWLSQINDNDGFNQALRQFENLKKVFAASENEPHKSLEAAVKTIEACQLAISQDRNNGDAYVILSNTYLGMANRFRTSGIYSMGIQMASAVILFWRDNQQMHTRNRYQADAMLEILTNVYRQMLDGEYVPNTRNRNQLDAIFTGKYQATFEKAINTDELSKTRDEALAWFEIEDALTYLESGQYQEASEKCENALVLCPRLGDVYYMRAQIKLAVEDYSGGINDIDMFERLNGPNDYSKAVRMMAQQMLWDQ